MLPLDRVECGRSVARPFEVAHMTPPLSRLLAASAFSALVATVGVAGPAAADEVAPTAECATATAELVTAKANVVAARQAFVAMNRPLGKLITAERAAARVEVRTSRTALRRLEGRLGASHDKAARKALEAQIKAERADIRHGNRLLGSKGALLAEIKADRDAANKAFSAAKSARAAAQVIAEAACPDAPTEPTGLTPAV
jgi:hypothetical protein